MKKLVATLIATGMLVGMGTVMGQVWDTAAHGVNITIPQVALLRFTSGTSNAPVTAGLDVVFDFSSGFDAADLVGTKAPTNTTFAWDDLKVFVNRNIGWSVSVGVVQTGGTAAFPWSAVAVTPTGLAANFNLGGGTIATSNLRGWQSLGFGQDDFRLTLTGAEIADTYVATVTYTLATP